MARILVEEVNIVDADVSIEGDDNQVFARLPVQNQEGIVLLEVARVVGVAGTHPAAMDQEAVELLMGQIQAAAVSQFGDSYTKTYS